MRVLHCTRVKEGKSKLKKKSKGKMKNGKRKNKKIFFLKKCKYKK
jgi:hypothetical protein